MRFEALVFDVLGTVVDEDGSVRRAVAELLPGSTAAAVEGVAADWLAAHESAVSAVVSGRRPWVSGDRLRREALREVLDAHPEVGPSDDAVRRAADVGHRLDPWPDSPAALRRLATRYRLVALTNGSEAQSAAMSDRAGLAWHHLLTADEVRRFKPADAAYRLPLERLGLTPATTLFVAAHPWDLDGAARHGYRTALVRRPGVEAPADAYDLQVTDLGELADRLLPE